MPPPFVLFSLPRSRSAWLAHWLSQGGPVGHDTLIECDSPEDFFSCFERGMKGCVETAGVQGWRIVRARLPQARFVTIRRPLTEVVCSLASKGAYFGQATLDELHLREAMLDEIETCGEAERVEFSSLRFAPTRHWLWRHLWEEEIDEAWDEEFSTLNIQVDMEARLSQLAFRRDANLALASSISSLSSDLPPCPRLQ